MENLLPLGVPILKHITVMFLEKIKELLTIIWDNCLYMNIDFKHRLRLLIGGTLTNWARKGGSLL